MGQVQKPMKILAIETSCDETGVCIVEAKGGLNNPEFKVLANITATQILLHAQYGGVFPMMAKREHAKNLTPIFEKILNDSGLLKESKQPVNTSLIKKLEKTLEREHDLAQALIPLIQKIKKPKIDAIAVTYGPGLEPTLWVGINFAKALSLAWDIPVVPINHMEGHITAGLLKETSKNTYKIQKIKFPTLTLLISGGHTELVLMRDWFKYKIIGETLDDAVGEAFDKVARMLELPYPGGPEISRLAKIGKENQNYKLPRPMLHSKDLNFSFSGLKTAVLYLIKKIPKLSDSIKADISREFENACVEVLISKTKTALKKYKTKTLILGGGVSANEKIRKDFKGMLNQEFHDCELHLPNPNLTGDNALMIAGAGYLRLLGAKTGITKLVINPSAKGNLRL